MDLSTFDTINCDLFLSKLKAYGFNENSVSFIKSYLTNRYQRTKIGSTFSDWNKIITGVPQCSILEPLFFNIFINDLLLFANKSEICSHAQDNTLYAANFLLTISDLSNDFETLKNGFMITIWH